MNLSMNMKIGGCMLLLIPGLLWAQGAAHFERALFDQSVALEAVEAEGQSQSEFGMELRPKVTESDVSVGLRIYMPNEWNKEQLQERLARLEESAQFRVAALEWADLMAAYRAGCKYRYIEHQMALLHHEMRWLYPMIKCADEAVEKNQLDPSYRAGLWVAELDLVMKFEKLELEKLECSKELYELLGSKVNLDVLAEKSRLALPREYEFDAMLRSAYRDRAALHAWGAQAQSYVAAQKVALSENKFRLKYVQPFFEVDHENGGSTAGISASFILPWGRRSSDARIYQQEQHWAEAMLAVQQKAVAERLQVLLKISKLYKQQKSKLLIDSQTSYSKLKRTIASLDPERMDHWNSLIKLRKTSLEIELHRLRVAHFEESLAIDLAEEMGAITERL